MNKLLTTVFAFAVASVTILSHAQEIKGDATAGSQKIAMCIGCHGIVGYKTSFPEVYKVPKIAGQGEKYIVAALNEYKKGDRKYPSMRAIAQSLSDQDIADVAAYYSALGVVSGATLPDKPAVEPSPQVSAMLAKANCIACHGSNFAKPIDPTYPQLAGQNADYLLVALKEYKTDNNPHFGRGNAIMAGVAKQFSDADLNELAQYISSLDGNLKTVPESRFR